LEKDSVLHQLIISHVLKRIELTEEQQQHFCSLLTVRRLLPRQYLVQQGEVCHHESYVCKGFLRSFYLDEKGNDYTLHFAMEDWWISDSTSFHLEAAAVRNIVALEASTLLQIEKSDLEQLYRDIPACGKIWRVMEHTAGISQDQRIMNSISMTGAERYTALTQKYPTLEQRLPQRHIASYLGITPVFLSQIRKSNARQDLK
jgi:CRP/FNR family cyclic AMP-dependent transcriptional regulator